MEAEADSHMDDFARWDIPHLRDYLAKRGVTQKGNKDELVALAYSCNIMNRPLVDTYKSDIQQAFNDYEAILTLPTGIAIPDPLKIMNGWIGEEEEGMKMWPDICIGDIMNHFNEQHVNTDQLLSKYKDEKGYDYFKTEWLKEILYHPLTEFQNTITGIDQYCLLKAKCSASQKFRDTCYDVWVLAKKDKGKIIRAYCNCAAG